MVQTITKEWQITKMYIYEVVLRDGVISLDWDDFETFANENIPLLAIRNEGDTPVKDLVKEAMDEAKNHYSDMSEVCQNQFESHRQLFSTYAHSL